MLYDIKSHQPFSGVKEPIKESSLDGCCAAVQLTTNNVKINLSTFISEQIWLLIKMNIDLN